MIVLAETGRGFRSISPRSGVNPRSEQPARLPVASDLRILVTSLRMSADLERMGEIGAQLARKVGRILEDKDVVAARAPEAQDDAVDRLHRALFTELLSPENPYAIETAIDVTLLSRHYERFADHAVSVAHRLVFLVTGEQDGQQ